MQLTQLAFMAMMLVALTAAFSKGGRTERASAVIVLLASLVTPLLERRVFWELETGVALVDVVLLGFFLVLAVRSSRRWPVYAAAFQALCVMTHIARMKTGAVHSDTYATLAAFWAYPVLLALVWGSVVEASAKGSSVDVPDGGAENPARKGRRNRSAEATRDDATLLTELLALHGLGGLAGPIAAKLLDRTGSFGAAIATSETRLRAWGMDDRVVAALAFARNSTRSALRRKLETRLTLENGEMAVDYLHSELAHLPHEQFRVLYLNVRHRLIHDEVHGEGSISEAPVFPREIVKRALEVGAANIILAHNHPGGDPSPSRADIAATRAIKDAARSVGVAVVDHIIVCAAGHVSMRAAGLL